MAFDSILSLRGIRPTLRYQTVVPFVHSHPPICQTSWLSPRFSCWLLWIPRCSATNFVHFCTAPQLFTNLQDECDRSSKIIVSLKPLQSLHSAYSAMYQTTPLPQEGKCQEWICQVKPSRTILKAAKRFRPGSGCYSSTLANSVLSGIEQKGIHPHTFSNGFSMLQPPFIRLLR